jgi:stage III sporulation protein AE
MRLLRLFFLFIIFMNLVSPFVLAEEIETNQENIILKQIDKLNLTELQREVDRINKKVEDVLPRLNIKELILSFIKGELKLNWKQLLKGIIKYMGGELSANLYILGEIIVLAVISAILSIFHNSFSSQTISNTANILIFLILSVLIIQSFQVAINIGIETVNSMVSFMQALVPILLTLLLSMGAFTSAAIFHPITFLIMTFLTSVIKSVVFPMIFLSAILTIVNNITDEFRISRLASLFKEFSMGILSLMLILFTGGLLLQGGAAAISDSLSLRTAKYLTGALIPVIGRIFSDAVDLIVSCSLIIKNALNFFGVLVIIIIIASPIIKLIVLIVIYKLASALIQPVSDIRLVNILNDLGNSLVMVFVVVSGVALMFFITITVIVGAANLSVMMR